MEMKCWFCNKMLKNGTALSAHVRSSKDDGHAKFREHISRAIQANPSLNLEEAGRYVMLQQVAREMTEEEVVKTVEKVEYSGVEAIATQLNHTRDLLTNEIADAEKEVAELEQLRIDLAHLKEVKAALDRVYDIAANKNQSVTNSSDASSSQVGE